MGEMEGKEGGRDWPIKQRRRREKLIYLACVTPPYPKAYWEGGRGRGKADPRASTPKPEGKVKLRVIFR